MSGLLRERGTSPRDDLRDHPVVQSQRPPPVGMESCLQQYDGTNIFQWFTRKAVYWNPHGEPIVIDDEKCNE